jgi:hypothetical protein
MIALADNFIEYYSTSSSCRAAAGLTSLASQQATTIRERMRAMSLTKSRMRLAPSGGGGRRPPSETAQATWAARLSHAVQGA